MTSSVTENTMEHVAILAQLDLNKEEKVHSANDMNKMLMFIDELDELTTDNVKPVSHVLPLKNVFREDSVINASNREELLKNATVVKEGQIVVPRTVEME